MQKNDIPREEYEELVRKVYQKAVMDKKAQEKIRENLLKYSEYNRKNKCYRVFAAVAAAVLLFFVCNGLLIGLNLHHSRQEEKGEIEMSEVNVTESKTDYVERNRVVYKFSVYPEYENNTVTGESQCRELTVKVVLVEEYVGNLVNKKENQITGNFVLRIADATGNVLGEVPLSTGAVSECGLTLKTDKKSMDKYFRLNYGGTVVFSMPLQTVKSQKQYLSSFYEVTENGQIFAYKLDSEIPDSICGGSSSELITSEWAMSPVVNMDGYWTDYHWLNEEGDACLAVYYLNEDSGCIELRKLYEGIGAGPAVDAGEKAMLVKYDVLSCAGNLRQNSDEFVEMLATDEENNLQFGYQQVKPWLFENEEMLLDCIEDSVTELSVLGFSDREALRNALFEEAVEITVASGKKIQVPRFKTVNGKLCLCNAYSTMPWFFTGMPVVVTEGKNMNFFVSVSGDCGGILRIELVWGEDGTWRAREFQIFAYDEL